MYFETECVVAVVKVKVIDFSTNRKHVCNFLLVISSRPNLGRILQVFC